MKIVVNKAIPPLTKKKLYLPIQSQVKIIITPKESKAIKLPEYRQQLIKQAAPPAPSPPQPPRPVNQAPAIAGAAISRNSKIKTRRPSKKGQVIYRTSDPNPESAEKLKSLRNIGSGRVLVIIGNGPSITEMQLEKLKWLPKLDMMSVNKPDHRVWPTTYWIFFDLSQLRRNEEIWQNYDGWILNSTSIKKQKAKSIQFKNKGGGGFSRDLFKGINIGRSSVYAGMQIGLGLNYDHIYIIGCDMNPDGLNGKLHFYGDNPDVEPDKRKSRFKEEAKHYEYAAKELSDGEKAKFTFCSAYNPYPFVDKFNKLDHRQAVEHIINRLGGLPPTCVESS